jgi:methionyl-tRNA synthetase
VDISSVPEAEYYICEVCASYVTVKPGAGVVPRGGEELIAVSTCAVCGATMSSEEYEAKGCIHCGADSEERQ